MTTIETWIAQNREALTSGLAATFSHLAAISSGHVSNEELAEATLENLLTAWESDRTDEQAEFGSWTETTKAVDEFLEAEGIVAEGWTLAVEQAHGDAPFGRGSAVRVFGSLHLTDAHAVGIAVQSIARIRAVGVE